jgi:hypothetical protein
MEGCSVSAAALQAQDQAADTFDFLVKRDGLAGAREYAWQSVRQLRRAVLDPVRYGMYKRRLATSYGAWKRLAFRADALAKESR